MWPTQKSSSIGHLVGSEHGDVVGWKGFLPYSFFPTDGGPTTTDPTGEESAFDPLVSHR